MRAAHKSLPFFDPNAHSSHLISWPLFRSFSGPAHPAEAQSARARLGFPCGRLVKQNMGGRVADFSDP